MIAILLPVFIILNSSCNSNIILEDIIGLDPSETAEPTATIPVVDTPTATAQATETLPVVDTVTPTTESTVTATEEIEKGLFWECGGGWASGIPDGPKIGDRYLPTGFVHQYGVGGSNEPREFYMGIVRVCLTGIEGFDSEKYYPGNKLIVNAGVYDIEGNLHPLKIVFGIIRPNGETAKIGQGPNATKESSITIEQAEKILRERIDRGYTEKRILTIDVNYGFTDGDWINEYLQVLTEDYVNFWISKDQEYRQLFEFFKTGTNFPQIENEEGIPILVSTIIDAR